MYVAHNFTYEHHRLAWWMYMHTYMYMYEAVTVFKSPSCMPELHQSLYRHVLIIVLIHEHYCNVYTFVTVFEHSLTLK